MTAWVFQSLIIPLREQAATNFPLQCIKKKKYWVYLFVVVVVFPAHVSFRKVMRLCNRFDITLSGIKQPVANVLLWIKLPSG